MIAAITFDGLGYAALALLFVIAAFAWDAHKRGKGAE